MRRGALIVFSALLLPANAAKSAEPTADPVVVRVGKTEVRAAELQKRLAKLHEFERDSFGSTAAEVRKNYIERRLLPELLEAEEAKRRRMHEDPALVAKTNALLAKALKNQIKAEVDAKLTDDEIQAYCEKSPLPDTSTRGKVTRGAARDCKRDFLSYRIALRREKAFKLIETLKKELVKAEVKNKDASLTLSLVIPERGKVGVKRKAK